MRIDLSESHSHDGFRSRLEVEIAAELDRLEVHHGYEVPWVHPETGAAPRYLPDFTIEPCHQAELLHLPRWVEGKPQQFIYDLYRTLGLERRVGTHFEEDVHVVGFDGTRLRDMRIEELWKPKVLAEMSGEGVLIVGAVGATKTLSVEMRPTEIVFSRTHPFVNQRGVEQRQRREEQRAEQERQARYWQAERDRQEVERRKHATVQQGPDVDVIRKIQGASQRAITPRFASACRSCGAHGADGQAHLCKFIDGRESWFRICDNCQATT